MATPNTWTPADDALLTAWHAQGKSLHSYAVERKRSKSTVSAASKRLGLDWDRSRTAGATQAKVLDAKGRRAALQLRALARAEHLFDRLEAPTFTTIVRGQYGVETEAALTFVPPKDERDLAVTIRTHLDAAMRLDQHDSGGAEAVRSLFGALADQLGLTNPDEPPVPE